MARYIDADKLNKKKKYSFQTQGEPFPKSEWFIKADDLYLAPTADVVEVVRCKDCKHRVLPSKMCMHPKAIGWDAIEPEDDDFCSYGEKALKEREKNENHSR